MDLNDLTENAQLVTVGREIYWELRFHVPKTEVSELTNVNYVINVFII